MNRMQDKTKQQVCKFVKKHLPNASLAEQLEAQAAVDQYLMVVYRIYQRLKREGKWPIPKRSEPNQVQQ